MTTTIEAQSLVLLTPQLDEQLSQLDPTNAAHRDVVLSTINRLVNDYVLPAMAECPRCGPEGVFDLIAVAGTDEIEGIPMSIFEDRMNGFEMPSDDVLKEALDYIHASTSGPEQRTLFWKCWAGNRAINSMDDLRNFLLEPLWPKSNVPPQQIRPLLSVELPRLEKLQTLTLNSPSEYSISSMVEMYREALAK